MRGLGPCNVDEQCRYPTLCPVQRVCYAQRMAYTSILAERERDSAEHSRAARDELLVLGERLADATRDLLPWIEGVARSKEDVAEQALQAWDDLMNAEYRDGES